MATTFKTLTANDIVNTRTLLHEAIPLTGTILSGTYSDNNIKTFNHGMFEASYDYPYLSSSANHVLDITHGYSSDSSLSGGFEPSTGLLPGQPKKINMYNEMASILVGHDVNGNIREFDRDGNLGASDNVSPMREMFFVNFARLLTKDEIKKGTFSINFITGCGDTFNAASVQYLSAPALMTGVLSLSDHGAATSYFVNSPAGEYGLLYTSSAAPNASSSLGFIYYQAGIAAFTSSVFDGTYHVPAEAAPATNMGAGAVSGTYAQLASSASIDVMAQSIRNRIQNISFNNTIELNSTIYFCRANHNEFNYSSNPTYLSSSQLRVKNTTSDNPVSYITTVGLYSSDNELLAVAKLSEPIKKTPDTELTLRVRLDY
tara:strand:- start:418 stop:1539 length:1122 start_codon:yes stop_codon:yes gene_type:complete